MPPRLLIEPSIDDIPQLYDIILETVSGLIVYFEDTITFEVVEGITDDALDEILEDIQLPPYLEPQPQTEMTINAGVAFHLFIG